MGGGNSVKLVATFNCRLTADGGITNQSQHHQRRLEDHLTIHNNQNQVSLLLQIKYFSPRDSHPRFHSPPGF